MDKINFDAFLQRINYSGSLTPDLDLLEALQRAQIYTIPMENFDIILGRGIKLAAHTLFDKLVNHKRGGYCFELNGLFLMALNEFGFDARPVLARVHFSGPPTGRGHQISLVSLMGKQWIVDVGFGNPNPRMPIPLELDHPMIHDGRLFRLTDAGPFGIMLQAFYHEKWQNLYSFDLEHVCKGDIEYGNHFCSTHPSSFFTTSRIAALPTPNGVITLIDNRFKKKESDDVEEMEIKKGQSYLDILDSQFGIKLDTTYDALVKNLR